MIVIFLNYILTLLIFIVNTPESVRDMRCQNKFDLICYLPFSWIFHWPVTWPFQSAVVSWAAMSIPLLIVIVFVFVIDYYVDAICTTRLEVLHTARFGSMAAFTVAVLLSFFWDHPFVGHVTNMRALRVIVVEDHLLSGGAVFSFVLFMFGE